MIPLAFADEPGTTLNEVDIDAETQQQTEIMNNRLGAEIRLLQLEKAIITNINTGEEIITILEESDVDAIDLQTILAEFNLLLQEVQSADPNATDAVSVFVDLKHDAVNLTMEFRETLRELSTDSMLDQIQQRTRNMTRNQTRDLFNSIQNKIRQYNSNQFRNLFQHLGENGDEYIHRYRNGSMTQNQLRQNITMRINQSEVKEQFTLLKSLKTQKIRNQIQTQNRIQNATEEFQQRQENRLQRRLQKIKDFPDTPLNQQLTKRIQNKLNNIGGTGGNGNGSNNEDTTGDSGGGQDKPGYGNNDGSNSPGGGI